MEYINILKEIVPKMKMQMHSNKGIASLDKIHKVIESFDKEKLNQCPRAKFENYFLSLLGIFLKTQELSELFKYLCVETATEEMVSFDKFILLFTRKDNEKLDKKIKEMYSKLKGDNESIPYDELMKCLKIENHPLVKVMGNTKEEAKKKVEDEFTDILKESKDVNEDAFTLYHKNLFWIMPEKSVDFWIKNIPSVWGIKVNDF